MINDYRNNNKKVKYCKIYKQRNCRYIYAVNAYRKVRLLLHLFIISAPGGDE